MPLSPEIIQSRIEDLRKIPVPKISDLRESLNTPSGPIAGQYIYYTSSDDWFNQFKTSTFCINRVIHAGISSKSKLKLPPGPLMVLKVNPAESCILRHKSLGDHPMDLAQRIRAMIAYVEGLTPDTTRLPEHMVSAYRDKRPTAKAIYEAQLDFSLNPLGTLLVDIPQTHLIFASDRTALHRIG